MSFGFGVVLGPLLGAAFFSFTGFFGVCMICAGLIMLPFIGCILYVKVTKGYTEKKEDFSVMELLKKVRILSLVIPPFLMLMNYGFTEALIQLYLLGFSLSNTVISLLIAMWAAVYAFGCPLVGMIPDRIDKRWTILIGLLF